MKQHQDTLSWKKLCVNIGSLYILTFSGEDCVPQSIQKREEEAIWIIIQKSRLQ